MTSTPLESNPQALDLALLLLIEECSEIIKYASKAKRFGLVDTYSGITNRQGLESELGDLLGIVQILTSNQVLNPTNIEMYALQKKLRLEKWAPEVAAYVKKEVV